jgi:hypothetical protein
MGSSLRGLVLPAVVGCSLAAIAPGCGSSNPNDPGGGDEKVVIPANAPKSQAEWYKQNLEANKQLQAKARKGAKR